jgi:hypothetical protein
VIFSHIDSVLSENIEIYAGELQRDGRHKIAITLVDDHEHHSTDAKPY